MTAYTVQFAIRTSIRNNKKAKRDDVIKRTAAIVGPGHTVDLTNYDLLILVEVYQVRNPMQSRELGLQISR